MMIDWNKPLQTRNGYPVRLLATDMKRTQPLVQRTYLCLVAYSSYEAVTTCHSDGRKSLLCESTGDIVNVPDKKSMFYCVYKGGSIGANWSSLAHARVGIVGNNVSNILEIVFVDNIAVETKFHSIVE